MSQELISLAGANAGVACVCNESNPAGTNTILRLAPACEIDTFPLTKAENGDISEMATQVELDGDIVFNATPTGCGYWREYQIKQYSGSFAYNLVGERGNKTFDNDILFTLTGTNAEVRGFSALIANGCFVASIQTKADEWVVIGDKDNHAWIEQLSGNSGAATTDANETVFVIRANNKVPHYGYEGVFDLTPNP